MSCSVYDTAWISCVVKPCGTGHRQWLFPSSFRFILDSQHPDGGWHWPPHGTYRCADGTILPSLAALFTIIRHKNNPLQLIRLQDEVANRLERGIEFVEREMKHLARTSEYSVGFDVLFPALLELLEEEGIIFHFTGRRKLFMDRDSKLSRVPLE